MNANDRQGTIVVAILIAAILFPITCIDKRTGITVIPMACKMAEELLANVWD